MPKLSTKEIKITLEAHGYSKLKRRSKKKDTVSGNIVRFFESEKLLIEVISDPHDERIISINPNIFISFSVIQPIKHEIKKLVQFDPEFFIKSLLSHSKKIDSDLMVKIKTASKILAIPEFNQEDLLKVSDFEHFLVVGSETFALDTQYMNTTPLTNAQLVPTELSGLYLETDYEFEQSSRHQELRIPANTLALLTSPEYSKFLFISPDLLSGISTSRFGFEPVVLTTNDKLANMGAETPMEDDNVSDWLTAEVSLKIKKYDFIWYHM